MDSGNATMPEGEGEQRENVEGTSPSAAHQVRRLRFWRVFCLALAVEVGLALLYTLIVPGLTGNALSDALCTVSMALGVISIVPVIVDMGRGMALPGVVGATDATRRSALRREHERREQGMTITFALGAATLVVALASFLISLL